MARAHTITVHPPRTPAQRMVMLIDSRHTRCPVDDLKLPKFGGWWFGHGYMQVRAVGRDRVRITNVWIDPRFRGQGHAASMFRNVLWAADQHGVSCELFAQQFDRGGLTTAGLWKWYESLGFVRKLTQRGTPYVNGFAVREPQPTIQQMAEVG